MTNLLKTRAVIALVPAALILAACVQQPTPEAHAAPMGGGTMGMQSGAGNQMSGMDGMMMQGEAGGQMADMNKMMMQMSQMMDRCNAMMQHDTMRPSGTGAGSHPQ